MVIALVAPAGRADLFETAARRLTGLAFTWVIYEREDEIRGKVRRLLTNDKIDGIFLGLMPYDRCRDLIPTDLQVGVFRAGATDLSIALAQALAKGWGPTPVSIDTCDVAVVHEVAQTLELRREEVACLPYDAGQTVEDIMAFHEEFSGDYMITGRTEVARRLAGRQLIEITGVPSTIRSALNEFAMRVQSRRHSDLRFAAGVFTVLAKDADRSRVAMMNMLFNTPELADAWIENRGRRGALVLAHRALLDRLTSGWASIPLVGTAETTLGFRIAAGFGIGSSARKSVLLAEQAVVRAEQEGGGCAYLLGGDGLIVGPMGGGSSSWGPGGQAGGWQQGDARRLEFIYRQHGAELEDLAKKVGLSPVTISRLAALEEKLSKEEAARPISPAELADALGITDPSGRRLLRTLKAHGLASTAGTEQASRRGRPITLYRLHLGVSNEQSADPA